MKLHQIDLNLLLALDALVGLKSVTRAADRLFISQPAMSHALNRLRATFDDPLLVRTPQGMQPTERALYLQRGVHQMLSQLETHLNQPEAFDPRTSQRRFTISTTDFVECVLIPPLVHHLANAAPGVHIDIQILREQVPEDALSNGEIDLVLGFDEDMQIPAYLHRETWLTEPLAGLLRAGHPLAGEALSLDQLILLPHVFHSPLGKSGSALDSFLAERGLSRSIAVNSQSYMSAAAIVSQSDHLFILPRRVASMMAGFWPLRLLALPAVLPGYHLNCVWHPVRDREPGLAWLRALMRDLMDKVAAEGAWGASSDRGEE
ncbi:LysR family transcriptional regulator [Paludibacterium purpuratum]|nr:LysR family transcriptional regulator [Paludibacterium purpuratum]